jgi:hypothetical protein
MRPDARICRSASPSTRARSSTTVIAFATAIQLRISRSGSRASSRNRS